MQLTKCPVCGEPIAEFLLCLECGACNQCCLCYYEPSDVEANVDFVEEDEEDEEVDDEDE